MIGALRLPAGPFPPITHKARKASTFHQTLKTHKAATSWPLPCGQIVPDRPPVSRFIPSPTRKLQVSVNQAPVLRGLSSAAVKPFPSRFLLFLFSFLLPGLHVRSQVPFWTYLLKHSRFSCPDSIYFFPLSIHPFPSLSFSSTHNLNLSGGLRFTRSTNNHRLISWSDFEIDLFLFVLEQIAGHMITHSSFV